MEPWLWFLQSYSFEFIFGFTWSNDPVIKVLDSLSEVLCSKSLGSFKFNWTFHPSEVNQMNICSTVAFPPLGNYDHVVVSVSIDFPSNSQEDALFHCIMTILLLIGMILFIIWEMFHGRISLNLVLLLLLVNFVTGFRLDLMDIFVIVNIRLSLTISSVFSCLCCCSWKSLFCLYEQNKCSESKVRS